MTPPPGKACRILVIDDDPAVADSIAGAFARRPGRFEARALHRSERALEEVRTWRPALVVVDALMPKVDGLEICEALRSGTEVPRIVAITGKRLTEYQRSFLAKHVDAFFTKPFDLDELLESAHALLGLENS